MKSLLAKYSNQLNKTNCYSWGILLVRLVMGLAFVYHGWGKIQTPFSWMPPEAPIPGFLQGLAALSEFGGGLGLVLGLLVPLGTLGMFFTMTVATLFHVTHGDPFVGMAAPTYELPLLYLVLTIFILLNGPGKFSADYKIFSR